jgi:uncharacterized protein (TIGR00255 family)
MTGFGSATGVVGEVDLNVEVRSVNHKGLDVKVSLPSAIAGLEPRILGLARQRLERGRVNLKVGFENSKRHGTRLVLDVEAAKSMARQLEAVRSALGIDEVITLDHVLTFPNLVLRDPSAAPALDPEEVWVSLPPIVEAALSELVAERDREGELLARDMEERLQKIAEAVDLIEVELPETQAAFLQRLKERVAEVVKDFSAHTETDKWDSGPAIGLSKDGYILMGLHGYSFKAAVRLAGMPTPPFSWDGVGTRHLAAMAACWILRRYPAVVIVRSDSGKVHTLVHVDGQIIGMETRVTM